MNKLALVALLGLMSLPLAACQNTATGFGRDMEKAGQSIQKTVNKPSQNSSASAQPAHQNSQY